MIKYIFSEGKIRREEDFTGDIISNDRKNPETVVLIFAEISPQIPIQPCNQAVIIQEDIHVTEN